MSKRTPNPSKSSPSRKKLRDKRVAAQSLDLVAPESRRASRAFLQALLAGELHDAITLCLNAERVMPLAALLRSLIDTSVLGIWLVKYAREEEAGESVAELSTFDVIERHFDEEDKRLFAFIYEPIKDTDHQFYRDVLHPSIHGDAIHLAMRIRDGAAQNTWVLKCSVHAHQVYCHFLLRLAHCEIVPEFYRTYVQSESARIIRTLDALLKDPKWQQTKQYFSI